MKGLPRFLRGAAMLIRGTLFFFRHPSLWYLGAVPVLLTIVFFVTAAVVYFHSFPDLMDMLTPFREALVEPEGWWPWFLAGFLKVLRFLIGGVLFVAFFVAVFFTFVVVVNILGAPFNDLLCARVEAHVRGEAYDAGGGWKMVFRDAWISIIHSLARLLILTVTYVPLWVASLLTGGLLTVVLTVVGFPVLVFFLALEFVDVPMSRRRSSLREKFSTVWSHRAPMLGFGTATMVATMIPIVNVVVIPFAVTGMTLLYLEEVESQLPISLGETRGDL